MENQEQSPIKRFLIIGVMGIICILLIIIFIVTVSLNHPSTPGGTLSLPGPIEIEQNNNLHPRPIPNVDFVNGFPVNTIHWINNSELAYSLYDTSLKRTIISKSDKKTRTVLLDNPHIKIPTFFWANNNNLLILDFIDPNQTYVMTPDGNLKNLNFQGFGYSWASDGKSFFFGQYIQGQIKGGIYTIQSNTPSLLPATIPSFTASFWSPTNTSILLYNFNEEDSNTDLYIFDFTTNTIKKITDKKITHPTWSPRGDRIAYLADTGLYINSGGNEKRIFSASGSIQFVSYAWSSPTEIIIFDSGQPHPKFFRISLTTLLPTATFADLLLTSQQRAEISISPDGKTAAVASEKDGLWFVKNSK